MNQHHQAKHVKKPTPQKNVLSISGGKYTTFRKMGQTAVNALTQQAFVTRPGTMRGNWMTPTLGIWPQMIGQVRHS